MHRAAILTLLILIPLAGCRSGAFASDRVAGRVERPRINLDDLLLVRFDLGYHYTHVLEVVGSPDVRAVALTPTESPQHGGIARSYRLEAELGEAQPVAVATVHVHEPTGLSFEYEDGGGTNSVLGVKLSGWQGKGTASGFAALEDARAWVRTAE